MILKNQGKLLALALLVYSIIAFSSGNHAIAVATASKIFGIKAAIVMPADAPKIKLDTTRSLGATVVT
ncbi:MAG TPA: pyridoxal-phosphate dependent enzyme, partial [Bacillota bacterium]|nr:pyridoxal-phosphate dependent enzyme [Bacillota bacterium]